MTLYYTNKYCAEAACLQCEGIIRHEPWCSVVNSRIRYARVLQRDPSSLSTEDRNDLQGMGVAW